ncbi:hypothetical protein JZ785_21990 [Alicyclobacillus curvatus]|nr:hypothetical protein JZ785_21990 [Alicyclobacillus curvatus]
MSVTRGLAVWLPAVVCNVPDKTVVSVSSRYLVLGNNLLPEENPLPAENHCFAYIVA